jgi:hypothetical protein
MPRKLIPLKEQARAQQPAEPTIEPEPTVERVN